MLVLGKCRLVCCPKTGSKFCTAALIRSTPNAIIHDGAASRYHAGVNEGPGQDRPSFGFVRYPVTWYESYWRHRLSYGWKDDHNIDRECQSDDLERFVESVVDRYPGWMGRYFEQWLGKDHESLAFVGRFENLVDDLCLGLKKFDQPFDESKLRATEPINVGNAKCFPAAMSGSTISKVVDSERRIIERFYAETIN